MAIQKHFGAFETAKAKCLAHLDKGDFLPVRIHVMTIRPLHKDDYNAFRR